MSIDRGTSNLRDGKGVVHARSQRIPYHVSVACDAADAEWTPASDYAVTRDDVTCKKCRRAGFPKATKRRAA